MAIDIASPGANAAALSAALRASLPELAFLNGAPLDLNGAHMVHFPTSATLTRATALTTSDSSVGTVSFILNDLGGLQSTYLAILGNDDNINAGDGDGISVIFAADGAHTLPLGMGVELVGATGTPFNRLHDLLSAWRVAQNNHLLISWDTTSNPLSYAAFLNGQQVYSNPQSITGAFTIPYTGAVAAPGFIGCNGSGSAFNIGNIFLDTAHSIVGSDNTISSANVAKFFKNGQVQSLGSDGSTPFGVAPAIYFTGNAASFPTNRGTGGAFTLTGVITDV